MYLNVPVSRVSVTVPEVDTVRAVAIVHAADIVRAAEVVKIRNVGASAAVARSDVARVRIAAVGAGIGTAVKNPRIGTRGGAAVKEETKREEAEVKIGRKKRGEKQKILLLLIRI